MFLEQAPACLRCTPATEAEAALLAAAGYAMAWISRASGECFPGAACRPDWQLHAPETRLEEGGSCDPRSSLYAAALTLLAAVNAKVLEACADGGVHACRWLLDDAPARLWRECAFLSPSVRDFFASACARSRRERPSFSSWPGELRLLWPEQDIFPFPAFRIPERRLQPAALQAWWAEAKHLRWWALAAAAIGLSFVIFFYFQ